MTSEDKKIRNDWINDKKNMIAMLYIYVTCCLCCTVVSASDFKSDGGSNPPGGDR